MQLITQGKTNYIFLLIIFVVAIVAGSLVWWASSSGTKPLITCGSATTFACDRTCAENSDCIYTCGCGAINVNESCKNNGLLLASCIEQNVVCENNQCVEKGEKTYTNNSEWQTYTNEEYGFEFEYPKSLAFIDWPNDWSISNYAYDKDELVLDYININEVPDADGPCGHSSRKSSEQLKSDFDKAKIGDNFDYAWKETLNQIKDSLIKENVNGIRYAIGHDNCLEFYHVLTYVDNTEISLSIRPLSNPQYKEDEFQLLDQILSTFRFLDESCENGPLPEEISTNLEFKKYINELSIANPGLSIKEFECSEKIIDADWATEIDIDPNIWTFSPNKNMAITTLRSYGEPDSDLWIYNRNGDQKSELLGSCGTPCNWPIAFWLNSEQFIAFFSSEYFGTEKSCSAPDGICYTYDIEIYDVSKNIITSYSFSELFTSRLKSPWWQEQCERVFGEESILCK